MGIQSSIVTADVYQLDIDGMNGRWVWDFGVFTLTGSEEYPVRRADDMTFFSAVVNGVDARSIDETTPDKVVDVEIYKGDYCVYVNSAQEQYTHALSPDNEPYTVLVKDVEPASSNQGSTVILEEDKSHGAKDKVAVEKKELHDNWTLLRKL